MSEKDESTHSIEEKVSRLESLCQQKEAEVSTLKAHAIQERIHASVLDIYRSDLGEVRVPYLGKFYQTGTENGIPTGLLIMKSSYDSNSGPTHSVAIHHGKLKTKTKGILKRTTVYDFEDDRAQDGELCSPCLYSAYIREEGGDSSVEVNNYIQGTWENELNELAKKARLQLLQDKLWEMEHGFGVRSQLSD